MPNPGPIMRSSRRVVPEAIKSVQLWVLWDLREKTPRAPWQTGHMFPAKWRDELPADERPETTYEEARLYASIPPAELDRVHSFPPTDALPERVVPTILLPTDPAAQGLESTLMYLDFDDVRDPETGEVTPEVADLLELLDSFTEISRSETGLHVLVYAESPVGWVTGEPLYEAGSIEIYDYGRFFGGTWRHVDGTPMEINERQAVVDEIIEEYVGDASERASDAPTPGDEPRTGGYRSSTRTPRAARRSSGDRSPYFDVALEGFAEPDPIERSHDDGMQGAHPVHGKTTGGNSDRSTNYNLDTRGNRWHCFAHDSGGGAMEMAAVIAGTMQCRAAGAGSLDRLSDDDLLETCLYACENLDGFTADMNPPYRAIVTVAERCGFPMADAERQVLGSTSYSYARAIYDELTVENFEELDENGLA